MRISELYFERTKSEPGYNNRKCGIKIVIEKTDKVNEALKKAEEFVAFALNEVLPDGQQMECALKSCKKRKSPEDNLPF
jgi:hypothetical protein